MSKVRVVYVNGHEMVVHKPRLITVSHVLMYYKKEGLLLVGPQRLNPSTFTTISRLVEKARHFGVEVPNEDPDSVARMRMSCSLIEWEDKDLPEVVTSREMQKEVLKLLGVHY